jgi:hypothetical protein
MKYSNGVLLSLMSPSGFCKSPIQRQREGKNDEQPSDVDELSEDDTDEPRKNREKAGGRACNPVATAGEDALSVLLEIWPAFASLLRLCSAPYDPTCIIFSHAVFSSVVYAVPEDELWACLWSPEGFLRAPCACKEGFC